MKLTNFIILSVICLLFGCYKPDNKGGREETDPKNSQLRAGRQRLFLHYHRPKNDLDGFRVKVSGEAVAADTVAEQGDSLSPIDRDGWGAVFSLPIEKSESLVSVKIHKGEFYDTPAPLSFVPSQFDLRVYAVQGMPKVFKTLAEASKAARSLGHLSDDISLEPAIVQPDSYLAGDWAEGVTSYQLYVRGFQDSDGDGHGDLLGVTSRLDYLQDLGVGAIVLSPIFLNSDGFLGREVVSYRQIDPLYGVESDLTFLVNEAHKRGIAVLLSYDLNHSSFSHPIFRDVLAAVEHPLRNFYLLNQNMSQDNWFSAGEDSFFARNGVRRPEFNYDNPDVIAFHKAQMGYWLNLGVDGFQFLDVHALYEDKRGSEDIQRTLGILHQFRNFIDQYTGRLMGCGAKADIAIIRKSGACSYVAGDGYASKLSALLKSETVRGDDKHRLVEEATYSVGQYLTSYNGEDGRRFYADIDRGRRYDLLRSAVFLQMTLPGYPLLFYGDEISLREAPSYPSSGQRMRVPMNWGEDSLNGGFSESQQLYLPMSPDAKWASATAARKNPDSLFHYYRSYIRLRALLAPLAIGDFEWLPSEQEVFAFRRSYKDRVILGFLNLSSKSKAVAIEVPKYWEGLTDPIGSESVAISEQGVVEFVLSGYDHRVYVPWNYGK